MTFEENLALVLPFATRLAIDSTDHGPEHWRRVAANGETLAAETPGADPDVVAAFAALHDSQRESEFTDHEHGLRAAMLVRDLRLGLTRKQRIGLVIALVGHDWGHVSADPTTGVCWDADRLDLPRVGIAVDPALLSTDAAKIAVSASDWWDRFGS